MAALGGSTEAGPRRSCSRAPRPPGALPDEQAHAAWQAEAVQSRSLWPRRADRRWSAPPYLQEVLDLVAVEVVAAAFAERKRPGEEPEHDGDHEGYQHRAQVGACRDSVLIRDERRSFRILRK